MFPSGPFGSPRSILRYLPLPLVGSWMYMTPSTMRMSVRVPMPVRSIEICIAGWSPVMSSAPFAWMLWPDMSIVIANRAVVRAAAAVLSRPTNAAGSTLCAPAAASGGVEGLGAARQLDGAWGGRGAGSPWGAGRLVGVGRGGRVVAAGGQRPEGQRYDGDDRRLAKG